MCRGNKYKWMSEKALYSCWFWINAWYVVLAQANTTSLQIIFLHNFAPHHGLQIMTLLQAENLKISWFAIKTSDKGSFNDCWKMDRWLCLHIIKVTSWTESGHTRIHLFPLKLMLSHFFQFSFSWIKLVASSNKLGLGWGQPGLLQVWTTGRL